MAEGKQYLVLVKISQYQHTMVLVTADSPESAWAIAHGDLTVRDAERIESVRIVAVEDMPVVPHG